MIDRRRRDDRYLEWKVWVFCLAAVFALGGIFLDERWLTGVAIALLVSAMFFRFLPGGGRAELQADEAEDRETVAGQPEDHQPEEAQPGM